MIGLFIGAREAGVEPLSHLEIQSALSTIDLEDAVDRLTRINVALSLDGSANPKFQRLIADNFLPAEIVENLLKFEGMKAPVTGIVTVRHLRMLLKLCAAYCQPGGMKLSEPRARYSIGLTLISLYETYAETSEIEDFSHPHEEYLHQFLSMQLFASRRRRIPFEEICVKEYIIHELISANPTLMPLLTSSIGCSPECFQAILFLTRHLFSQHTTSHILKEQVTAFCPDLPYGSAGLTEDVIEPFLERYCIDLSNGPIDEKELGDLKSFSDFRGFIRKPLVRYRNGTMSCLDFEFLEGLYVRGLWQALNDCVPANDRNRLIITEAGSIFEQYVNNKFTRIESARIGTGCVYKPSHIYSGGEFDGVYDERGHVLIVESKQGILTTSIRYGTSILKLQEHVDKKLVGWPEKLETNGNIERKKNRVGMQQLRHNIDEVIENWRKLGISKPKRIVPMIVVEDEVYASKPLMFYLTWAGKQLMDGLPKYVSDPIVLRTEDINALLERASLASPCDIIRQVQRSGFGGAMGWGEKIEELFPRLDQEDRGEMFVSIERCFPLLEGHLSKVTESARQNVSYQCSVCGQPMLRHFPSTGEFCWRCPSDPSHPLLHLSEEMLARLVEDDERCRKVYRREI